MWPPSSRSFLPARTTIAIAFQRTSERMRARARRRPGERSSRLRRDRVDVRGVRAVRAGTRRSGAPCRPAARAGSARAPGPSRSSTDSSASSHSRVSCGSTSCRRSMAVLDGWVRRGRVGRGKSAAGPGTLNRIMAGDDAESARGNSRFPRGESPLINHGHRARNGIVSQKCILSYYKTEFLRVFRGEYRGPGRSPGGSRRRRLHATDGIEKETGYEHEGAQGRGAVRAGPAAARRRRPA